MPPSITARTQTRPVYHRDARGTIRLRVASWEDNRHELFGRKGQMTWHPRSLRTRFTEGDLEHANYPLAPGGRGAAADLVQHESGKRIFPHRGDDRLGA